MYDTTDFRRPLWSKFYLLDFVLRVFPQSFHQLIFIQDVSVASVSAQQCNVDPPILSWVQRYSKSMQHMIAKGFEQSGLFTAVNLEESTLLINNSVSSSTGI